MRSVGVGDEECLCWWSNFRQRHRRAVRATRSRLKDRTGADKVEASCQDGLATAPPDKEASMIHLARDFEEMPEHLSSERLLALERIIPPETVQAVLEQTGHARRHCPILPHFFVAYLVLGLGLFGKDSHTIVFKHFQRFRPGGTPGRNTIAE